MMSTNDIAIRSSIFHFLSEEKYEFFEDGLLVLIDGLVQEMGDAKELLKRWEGIIPIRDERGKLLMPGFIDGHIHAVQNGILASYSDNLLDWLDHYTFPYEMHFQNVSFCENDIKEFYRQLLSNGTTSAAIYSSVHPQSLTQIMEESLKLNMRIIAGKTNMDRNAPDELLEETSSTYATHSAFIEKYHQHKRLNYALTPRFAITSSKQQLEALALLKKNYPKIHVQTHISENDNEIQSVKELFPERKDYLDVYEHYGLVAENTLLGHGIHLSDSEWQRVKASGASLVHCPTSNLFLGSGLFKLKKCFEMKIPVALGSDVGGGTSFSMLKTAAAAYHVASLQGYKPSALKMFFLLGLGGAQALGIGHKVGNFELGKEGDFILIDTKSLPLLKNRLEKTKNIEEILFALMMLGDDRNIDAVYLMGKRLNIEN